MSEHKKINFGTTSGEVGITSNKDIYLNDRLYGHIDEFGTIHPTKYGDPTLKINDYGYVVGCYDGKTYGRIYEIGLSTYIEFFDQSTTLSEPEKNYSGTALDYASKKYESFSNTPKKSGYSNSFGTKGKTIAFILLALFIIYSIVLFIIDSPF